MRKSLLSRPLRLLLELFLFDLADLILDVVLLAHAGIDLVPVQLACAQRAVSQVTFVLLGTCELSPEVTEERHVCV